MKHKHKFIPERLYLGLIIDQSLLPKKAKKYLINKLIGELNLEEIIEG